MHGQPLMTDCRCETDARLRRARHGHVCSADAPFARISIGPRIYEVADGRGNDAFLAFRALGQQEWCALDREIACGWIAIAADILLLDPDVLFEFLQTHAVRVNSAAQGGSQMDFDTLGIGWSARLLQNRDGEVRLGDGDWHHARLGLQAPSEGRARAIMILLAAYPDPRAMFEPHVTQWAHRIARGVHVQPIA